MIRKLTESDDRTKVCTLCVHFQSYQDSFFGDEHEPDDCGNCTVNRDKYGYPEFASSERTCEKFEPMEPGPPQQSTP